MHPYSTGAPSEWPAIFIHGGELGLAHGKRPPRICMKCGAKSRVERESRTFHVVSQGQQAFGAAGGAVGASMAAAFRDDPKLGVLAGAAIAGVVGVVATVLHKKSPSAEVQLAVCETCRRRMASAKAAARILLALLLGGLALGAFGYAVETSALIVLGVLLFVAGCVVAVVAKPARWNFGMPRMNESHVWLTGVAPEALAAIHQQLSTPKKTKRKKASADALEPAEPELS